MGEKAGSEWALKPVRAGWRARRASEPVQGGGVSRLGAGGKWPFLPNDPSIRVMEKRSGQEGLCVPKPEQRLQPEQGWGRVRLRPAAGCAGAAGGLRESANWRPALTRVLPCAQVQGVWVEVAGGTRTGRWLTPQVAAGPLQIPALPTAPEVLGLFFSDHM